MIKSCRRAWEEANPERALKTEKSCIDGLFLCHKLERDLLP